MKLCTKCGEHPALDNATSTCETCEERALDALIVMAIENCKAVSLVTCENKDDEGEFCGQPGNWYDGGFQNGAGWILCPSCADGYGYGYMENE